MPLGPLKKGGVDTYPLKGINEALKGVVVGLRGECHAPPLPPFPSGQVTVRAYRGESRGIRI